MISSKPEQLSANSNATIADPDIKLLSEDTFAKTVGDEKSSSVIEFFADWCKPCHKFSPVFEEAAQNFPEINFYRVDADREFILAAAFKAATLPTVLYVKNGVIKDVTVGNISKEALIESIQKII